MKKESIVNKKVLLLSLFLIILIAVNFVLVSAQDSQENLFRRWLNSSLTDIDAKVILFIMIAVILYILFYSLTGKTPYAILLSLPITFVLTVYVTPPAILGVLKSYNTLPLMISSILPLIVLGAFTFLAIEKNKKSLVMGQHTAWWIFLIFLIFRLIAIGITWSNIDANFNFSSTDPFYIAMHSFANMPTPEEATLFWIAISTQFIIAGIMSLKNGSMIGLVGNSVEETEEAIARRNAKKVVAGAKNLKEVEEGFEKT